MVQMFNLDVGCANATIIKTGTATFLVDCHEIDKYYYLLPSNKILRGVFVTHQLYDHYSGLEYLRENQFSIGYLIYSPYKRRQNDNSVTLDEWRDFNSHKEYFEKRGTKVYSPYRQEYFEKPWWEIDGLRFWMLGPSSHIAQSPTRELHDACLVFKVDMGKRKCLFAGDGSDSSLAYIASETTHICDDILHVSHHGSLNGAELNFIKKCDASYSIISTKSGVHENVPHPTALRRYRDHTKYKVSRTDIDGNLSWDY